MQEAVRVLVFHPWIGKIPWSRKWHTTPVFLPGKSDGERNLVGYSLQGCKVSDMTEVTLHAQSLSNPSCFTLHVLETSPFLLIFKLCFCKGHYIWLTYILKIKNHVTFFERPKLFFP